jgi:hypothetical protein
MLNWSSNKKSLVELQQQTYLLENILIAIKQQIETTQKIVEHFEPRVEVYKHTR